jgi:K+-transporting ATPase ATPase C chain
MKTFLQSVLQTILWTVVCGILYPIVITGIAKAFPAQAEGSLVYQDGKLVGSALIAQQFTGPTYFWPRPSAGTYATIPSGASNLGPTSSTLQSNVAANLKAMRDAHKLAADAPVPADLVYTSASGVDPHVSPEAARFQIHRVALARGVADDRLSPLVERFVEGPQWGVFGQARVNVLLLNLELDKELPARK